MLEGSKNVFLLKICYRFQIWDYSTVKKRQYCFFKRGGVGEINIESSAEIWKQTTGFGAHSENRNLAIA